MNPRQLAEERVTLSEEYSRYSGELAQLLKDEAEHYNENRKNYKSDTAVQKAFDVTDKGVRITIIKLKLKSLEKTMSSYKTLIDVATQEAHGMY